MGERRLFFGLLLTITWGFVVGIGLYLQRDALPIMTPNAWGDLFAGVFSPLAFLWLVLGYLQQGEELRLSTAALRLQAEELKNSVEQQRALVEVTRQQVESERATYEQERLTRERAAKPILVVETSGGAFRGDGHSTYIIRISNVGSIALGLTVDLHHPDGGIQRMHTASIFDRGQNHILKIEFDQPELTNDCQLAFKFRDGLGRIVDLAYRIKRESEHPHSGLVLDRIETSQVADCNGL